MQTTSLDHNDAVFSSDLKYRYSLTRCWNENSGHVLWIMLNPSTASQFLDDPTIRRCIGFSQRWGFKSLEVVNLFAFRATKPSMLQVISDPIGPENDHYIEQAAARADLIIYGWGAAVAKVSPERAVAVHKLVSKTRKQAPRKSGSRFKTAPQALWTTKDEHPSHPLFLSYDCTPRPFNVTGKRTRNPRRGTLRPLQPDHDPRARRD